MCTLVEKVKKQITHCVRDGRVFERDVLKTVLGEIQLIKARTKKMDDETVIKIFKKFKQGVLDTIKIMEAGGIEEHPEELDSEIDIYNKHIPTVMPPEVLVDIFENAILSEINDAKSDGQATGIAIGYMKKHNPNIPIDGKDVAEAVKMMRE